MHGPRTTHQVQALVVDLIRKLGGYEEVFGSSPYVSLGMDSFSSLEFISRIEMATGVKISLTSLTPETTVSDIIRNICGQVRTHVNTGLSAGVTPCACAGVAAPQAAPCIETGGVAL
jgi:acyl carrier protein